MTKTILTGLTALGTSKKAPSPTTFASGFSTGKIKIRQFSKEYNLLHEFEPSNPSTASSVIFLDYNSSNDNIAATLQNGLVNIYSLQTKIKFDTIKLDSASTIARFHPTKRSMLAVASYNGLTTLYDIFAKKPIFKNANAHTAPCSDVFFSDSYLLSCGYDGLINIFDIRKQKVTLTIKGTYGWTTLAMSNCGAYFVGGNMKGELVTYDLRSIKKPLASARVETGNHKISRVDFINHSADVDSQIDISNAVRNSLARVEEEIIANADDATTNDSYIEDIVDFHRGRISDFSTNAAHHGNRVSTPTRNRVSSRLSDFNYGNVEDFPEEATTQVLDDSCVTKSRRKDSTVNKRRSSVMTPSLQHINEEKENDGRVLNTVSQTPATIPLIEITNATLSAGSFKQKEINDDAELEESFKSVATGEDSKKTNDVSAYQLASNTSQNGSFDIRKEFETLKEALSEKIRVEVGMLNMDENFRFVQIMGHVGEQKRQLHERISMIEDSLGLLMSDDFKISKILELQAENDALRKQNQDLIRRMSH